MGICIFDLMLKRSIYWLSFVLMACQKNIPKGSISTSSGTASITINFKAHLPELVKIPLSFYDKMEIDEWEKLTRWCDQFEDISKMNNKGVGVFINGLEFQTRVFYKSQFPEIFDIYPVRSRLKVVQMQAQKAKFYAATEQYNKLNGALDTLYQHYNSFLNRILSMADETSLEVTR